MGSGITGIVELKLNNQLLMTKEASVKMIGLGGYERESVVGDQHHGYLERAVPQRCECTITDRKDVNVTQIAAISGATLTVEARDGKTYILPKVFCLGNVTVSSGDGSTTLIFESDGGLWQEILP